MRCSLAGGMLRWSKDSEKWMADGGRALLKHERGHERLQRDGNLRGVTL